MLIVLVLNWRVFECSVLVLDWIICFGIEFDLVLVFVGIYLQEDCFSWVSTG